jgi:hypothetical protein
MKMAGCLLECLRRAIWQILTNVSEKHTVSIIRAIATSQKTAILLRPKCLDKRKFIHEGIITGAKYNPRRKYIIA